MICAKRHDLLAYLLTVQAASARSDIVLILCNDLFNLIVRGLIVDDISEVEGVLPEDEHYYELEDQRDVA